MLQTQLINDFVNQEKIAVIGVSRKGNLPANHIFKKFRENDYRVFAVNPYAETIEGSPAYANLEAIPEKVTAVMLASTPEVSERIARDCVKNGIRNVWMHRGIGAGSYSADAEKYLLDNDITPIINGCPLMFVGKVDWFHKLFRWLKK